MFEKYQRYNDRNLFFVFRKFLNWPSLVFWSSITCSVLSDRSTTCSYFWHEENIVFLHIVPVSQNFCFIIFVFQKSHLFSLFLILLFLVSVSQTVVLLSCVSVVLCCFCSLKSLFFSDCCFIFSVSQLFYFLFLRLIYFFSNNYKLVLAFPLLMILPFYSNNNCAKSLIFDSF